MTQPTLLPARTFGSLFSGIGGFDLGFTKAGLKCVWQVELDPFARSVLAKHWPHVPRWPDVRTWPQIDAAAADVVCGGFPCQQTSVGAAIHGRRSGLAGPDSGLWYELLRVVRVARPDFVVVENVAGAASYQAEITQGLEAAGYCVPWGPERVSAADVGLPHRRWRLLWIAHRDRPGLEVARRPGPRPPGGPPGGAAARDAWLQDLGRTVRVADGVPSGVDRVARITACGNALVPALAEEAARRLIWK